MLTPQQLAEIRRRAEQATPGPWYVRRLDDDACMTLVAVSTRPDTGRQEPWPEFDPGEIVAATLVQCPRYVDVADQRFEANARFIAAARTDVPLLVAEVERLSAEVRALKRRLRQLRERLLVYDMATARLGVSDDIHSPAS